MNSLDTNFDRRLPLTHEMVRSIRVLGEYRGKEDLYHQQIPQALDTLKQAAIIQSTESSNRIEGIVASGQRIRDIVEEKTTPRDRSEQEIAGYRDVLNTIHGNYAAMRLTSGLVKQLHRDLFKYADGRGGQWKATSNSITERLADGTERVRFTPVEPYMVEGAMNELHDLFERRCHESKVDRLLLIPAYVLDFLCIHPFTDGNGRMARLLTLLLLYQAGYGVGRFISLEKIIEASKEGYYDTLYRCSLGWHEGQNSLGAWTEYLLGTWIAAYREFESRVGLLATSRGAKSEMIFDAIGRFHGEFSVSELLEQCPNVGVDLVRRILKEQRKAGKLVCLGRGPSAQWRRI